jgi:hypothetical protein
MAARSGDAGWNRPPRRCGSAAPRVGRDLRAEPFGAPRRRPVRSSRVDTNPASARVEVLGARRRLRSPLTRARLCVPSVRRALAARLLSRTRRASGPRRADRSSTDPGPTVQGPARGAQRVGIRRESACSGARAPPRGPPERSAPIPSGRRPCSSIGRDGVPSRTSVDAGRGGPGPASSRSRSLRGPPSALARAAEAHRGRQGAARPWPGAPASGPQRRSLTGVTVVARAETRGRAPFRPAPFRDRRRAAEQPSK